MLCLYHTEIETDLVLVQLMSIKNRRDKFHIRCTSFLDLAVHMIASFFYIFLFIYLLLYVCVLFAVYLADQLNLNRAR